MKAGPRRLTSRERRRLRRAGMPAQRTRPFSLGDGMELAGNARVVVFDSVTWLYEQMLQTEADRRRYSLHGNHKQGNNTRGNP